MQPYPRLASLVASLSGVGLVAGCPTAIDCEDTANVTTVCLTEPEGGCPTAEEAVAAFAGQPDECWRQDYDVGQGCGLVFKGTVESNLFGGDTGSTITECCYEGPFVLIGGPECVIGRPLRVAGRATVGGVRASGRRRPSALPRHQARRLAAAWTAIAQLEHAAVVAFERAERLLTAWGAPAHLLAETRRARADEVRHARAAFALASRYAGRTLTAAPLADPADRPSMADFAVETLRDAAVGEAVAVAQAAAALRHASDPHVRAFLAEVVADESRHAALGLATLTWLLEAGGDDVRRAVASSAVHAPALQPASQADDPMLAAHGLPEAGALAHASQRALTEVALPAVRRLLAA